MPLINQLVLHPFIFTHPANSKYTLSFFGSACTTVHLAVVLSTAFGSVPSCYNSFKTFSTQTF